MRVGFVGLGRMGRRMAARLLDAGLEVVGYDAVPGQAAWLPERGGRIAASAREVAAGADATISMVTDGAAVLQVLEGPDGLLAGAAPGFLYVDMSTIGVEDSARVAESCHAAGARYVRASVLGTLEAAESGTLTALVSGPPEDAGAARPFLAHLCAEQHYLGQGEEGRLVKLILNGLLATSLASLAEGMVLAGRAGVDIGALLDVVVGSAMASPALKGTVSRLRERSFEPRLTTALLAKDLGLLAEAARSAGAPLPLGTAARDLFRTAARGHADQDASAVLLSLEAEA